MKSGFTVLKITLIFFNYVIAYKPVVIMHGILSGSDSMLTLEREIENNHPGTKVYNCDMYDGWSSLESAWRQVKKLRDYIDTIGRLHPEGIILLGFSQGGLLARATLQSLPSHNVKTFISLSAPQAGQYGTDFLHLIFPNLVAKKAFKLFYNEVGQQTSVGNYWNDPHMYEIYLKSSIFLPLINNEVKSSNSSDFKDSLIKLEKMVLIGGPHDGVIAPWESSHFGYFNSSLDVVPYNERDIFRMDAIGLRTLQEMGKLVITVEPFVHHLRWHRDEAIIQKVILPHLD